MRRINPKRVDQGKLNDQSRLFTLDKRNNIGYFSLEEHSSEWCHNNETIGITIPNCKTLRLRLNDDNGCLHYEYYSQSYLSRFQYILDDGNSCKFLTNLHPKTLILDNYLLGKTEIMFSKSLPKSFWLKIETLVLILPSFQDGLFDSFQSTSAINSKKNDLPKLLKIYWIFMPTPKVKNEIPKNAAKSIAYYHRGYPRIQPAPPHQHELIISSVIWPNVPITYINSGSSFLSNSKEEREVFESEYQQATNFRNEKPTTLNHLSKSYQAKFKEFLEEKLISAMRDQQWTEEKQEARLDTIQFKTLEEWMKEDDLKEGLDSEEWEVWADYMSKKNGRVGY
ncbi:uncharacterized protein L201_001787 [Kwoniella dendrophila CBS 6074]|uniref:HNH nuclease domain-containing protein n=1 Tax=Kwoniella dendrophila CBS 6074 TaxID=1295534 RepID=A0AAX4JQX3_9TREE